MRSAKGLPFLLQEGMEVVFVPPVLHVARTARVERITEAAPGRMLVFFDTIDNRNDAEKLVGHRCLVRVSDLPEGWDQSDEVDLGGFMLHDVDGTCLGAVLRVEENPAHPLLVVDHGGREVLVPLAEELLVAVSEEDGTITMELPTGLFEL